MKAPFFIGRILLGGLLGVDEPWEAKVPVAQPSFTKKVTTMGRRLVA